MTMDESEIAALIADLDHSDKPTIRAAVDALIPIAAESPDLRARLCDRLTRSGHKNYWPVAYILGQLPAASSAVVQTLLDALDHREPDIRWAMALLLIHVAQENSEIVRRLVELSASGTTNQKRMALYCIRDLILSDAESLTALLNGLNDSDPTVRVAAAICLKPREDLKDDDRNLLLKAYLEDSDLRVRNAAAIVLANLGSPSQEFLSALRAASESKDSQTKKAAVAALELLEKRRSAPAEN
jgi:HEAT repeat protein